MISMLSGHDLLWIVFNAVVLILLVLDMGISHKKSHEIPVREALWRSGFWILLALLFNLGLYFAWGPKKGLEFFTGYLLELSLSVDNLFVFILIFSSFKVPHKHQYKVLFWGIIGVLITRAGFILAGVSLVEKFHWVIYIFGAFLIFSGIRMLFEKDKEVHPEHNSVFVFFRKLLPVTKNYVDDKFFVKEHGRFFFTPLFIVLLAIDVADIIFALDSIPAIISITRDSFIVYSSNICAIMGLRSLYFALAGIMKLFRFLNYGLSVILIFIGCKMLLEKFIEIPIAGTLGFIAGTLMLSILISVVVKPKDAITQIKV